MAEDDHLSDMQDSVAAAVAALKDGSPPPDEPSLPLEAEPDVVPPQSFERHRDERGRFAQRRAESLGSLSPDQEKQAAAIEIEQAVSKANDGKEHLTASSEPVDYTQAPARLSAIDRQHWKQMPPNLQRAWYDMERNTARGVEALKARHQEQIGHFEQAFAPLRQQYRSRGIQSDAHALQILSAAQQALDRDPAGSIVEMIRQAGPAVQQQIASAFGIQNRAAAPQQYYQPQQQIDPGIAQAGYEIQAFAADPRNEFFPALKDRMGQLLHAGECETLRQAYDRAFRESHFYKEMQAQQRVSAQKRAAASSLSGAPHGAAPPMRNGHIRGRNHHEDAAHDVREAINQLR